MSVDLPIRNAVMRDEPISSSDLTWRSHPARRRPRRAAAAIFVIVAVSTACALAGHSVLWGIFATLVLVLSLDTYFFPSRYFVRDDGILVQRIFSRSDRPWSSFRRVYRDGRGLTLSPYGHRTMLEPYRSVRVLFDGGSAQQIEARIRTALGASVEWIEVPPR